MNGGKSCGRNPMRISRNTTDSCSMKSRNTKEKRSRKPLNGWSASKNPNKGILRPRMRGRKRKRQSGREFGPKKVRILRDCLFPACQGLKIGINRQLLQSFYLHFYFNASIISLIVSGSSSSADAISSTDAPRASFFFT